MSRYRLWEPGDRPASRKQPPPEHGIKVKKTAGTSWWGQRWLSALTAALGVDAGRLARGQSYARAGRTHDLIVSEGKVQAKVTGSRAAPYEVTIELSQLGSVVWQEIVAGMAAKAQFAAELLAGHMPQELEDLFRAAGTSLFPLTRADLKTSCTCPDSGDPCKHVAAAHYVLGDALDRDPFLLFELRGRSKEAVLEALRKARSTAPTEPKRRTRASSKGAARQLLSADYDRPRAPLPTLQFSFEPKLRPGAVLDQLGKPLGWNAEEAPARALLPVVQAAAERARSLALAATPSEDTGILEDESE